MNKNFKYPTLRMFFDADKIACVFVDDIVANFKGIQCLSGFSDKAWDIGEVDVMAVSDVQELIFEFEDKTKWNFVHFDKNHLINTVNGMIFTLDGNWVSCERL